VKHIGIGTHGDIIGAGIGILFLSTGLPNPLLERLDAHSGEPLSLLVLLGAVAGFLVHAL
jgi:hypothetical protein